MSYYHNIIFTLSYFDFYSYVKPINVNLIKINHKTNHKI